jgi:glycosyltransferase involved in cell wall biosynthesis
MATILFVSFSTELYGSERCLLQLIEGLSRKGYHAIVATPRPGPLTERLEALNVPLIFVPSMKRWLPHPSATGLKRLFYSPYQFPFLLRSAVILRDVIRQHHVDLVHTQTSVVFDGALAAAWANVPHVWHLHEALESGKEWKFFLGTKFARNLISRFSARIISTSEAIRRLYLDTTQDKEKLHVVYNGVDLSLHDSDVSGATFRLKLGISPGVRLVGMIAQMVPRKRQEDLLRAAVIVQQSVPDSFFLLVGGDLDTPYARGVQKLSQDLGLAERIVWLGFHQPINEVFKAIDLLVLPSVQESTPRVIIEAMAACRPVVATAVDGVPELVVDGVTGFLVPPQSPPDLARAMIRVLQEPALAKAMGQAGRERAERNFSLDQYVNNIEEVYLELLACAVERQEEHSSE